jgi:hypothetical protein
MDPQVTLRMLAAAILDNDEEEAANCFEWLWDWAKKDGFMPDMRVAMAYAWQNR